MGDPEELDMQRRFPRLSMRSKILLLSTPFILCTLFLSMTAGPFLMDMIVGVGVEEEGNMSDTNSTEPGESDVYLTILQDDFNSLTPHWTEWMMNTGTGSLSNGTFLLTLSNQSNGVDESVAALYDYTTYVPGGVAQNAIDTMPWLHRGMDVRLRCSNDNKLESDGSKRWWGFVDFHPTRMPPYMKNALYFRSNPPEHKRSGFTVESIVNGDVVFRENLTGIDMREWHTYTVIWNVDNATFKVDGEVVASVKGTGMVPDEAMATYIVLSDIISSKLPYTLSNLTVDQSIEIDYIHLFYADEEVYINESEFISELFANASGVIDWVEEEGFNTTNLRSLYSMAESNWTYYLLPQTKEPLEAIISQTENFKVAIVIRDNGLFDLAEEAIQKAESEGRERDALPMKSNLDNAKKNWEKQNYRAAQIMLEAIFRMMK